MTINDERELAAWRLAFDHLGDGTPNGAAQTINEQIAKLQAQRDQWQRCAQSVARIATAGSVYEIETMGDTWK